MKKGFQDLSERERQKVLAELREIKGKWRDQVLGEKGSIRLPYLARVVAYWLADAFTMEVTAYHYFREQEVVVFPGQKGLADRIGCYAPDVSRAIGLLLERKHLLKVDKGLCKTTGRPPNEYLIVLGKSLGGRKEIVAEFDRKST